MPLIAAIKNTLFAAFLAMILAVAVVGIANADSHLPDCKKDARCLLELREKWKTVTVADMQAMINAGADVNATDDYGVTPLHAAADRGNAEIISVLVKAEADLHAKENYGLTPLHTAAARGHAEVIPILVKAGADVNAKSKRGATPLDFAVSKGHVDVINMLTKAGSKSTIMDYERKKLSPDGLVEYNFVYKPHCKIDRDCVVIEAKTIHGCPRSLYMSLILFDSQKRNIGWTNAVARGLRKGESALLEFSIIEKNATSYRVDEINCN